MAEKVRVGVVGCGAICGAYFKMAPSFPILEIAACADLEMEKARARAAEFGIPRVLTPEELLRDDGIDLVLNLTVPKAHAPVALQALEHGKHTYHEKPFAVTRAEGEAVLAQAAATGLRVGCAPDTFLGAGIQTARKLLDDGAVGRPLAFTAFMMCPGHESWHPNPEFYYEAGGGPMFDMGPYYLTALLNLLGPVRRLSGLASIAIPERTIASAPKRGKKIAVETPDHICGALEFENGAVGTIVTSFAVTHPEYDRKFPITVYGTEGALKVPDPNGFDGEVRIRRAEDGEWREAPHAYVKGYGRAVGVADMAHALRSGRPHRARAEQAFTVLDLMQGFLESSAEGRAVTPSLPYERPRRCRPISPSASWTISTGAGHRFDASGVRLRGADVVRRPGSCLAPQREPRREPRLARCPIRRRPQGLRRQAREELRKQRPDFGQERVARREVRDEGSQVLPPVGARLSDELLREEVVEGSVGDSAVGALPCHEVRQQGGVEEVVGLGQDAPEVVVVTRPRPVPTSPGEFLLRLQQGPQLLRKDFFQPVAAELGRELLVVAVPEGETGRFQQHGLVVGNFDLDLAVRLRLPGELEPGFEGVLPTRVRTLLRVSHHSHGHLPEAVHAPDRLLQRRADGCFHLVPTRGVYGGEVEVLGEPVGLEVELLQRRSALEHQGFCEHRMERDRGEGVAERIVLLDDGLEDPGPAHLRPDPLFQRPDHPSVGAEGGRCLQPGRQRGDVRRAGPVVRLYSLAPGAVRLSMIIHRLSHFPWLVRVGSRTRYPEIGSSSSGAETSSETSRCSKAHPSRFATEPFP
jgi:predicted dehydrogenase